MLSFHLVFIIYSFIYGLFFGQIDFGYMFIAHSEIEANLSFFVCCCRWCVKMTIYEMKFSQNKKFSILRGTTVCLFLFSHFIWKQSREKKSYEYLVFAIPFRDSDSVLLRRVMKDLYFYRCLFLNNFFSAPEHTHEHTKQYFPENR